MMLPEAGAVLAISRTGERYEALYGAAPALGATLTALAFKRGLSPLGDWGDMIVTICVGLFALSTAISWSYYGDRCAMYLFGAKAVRPYRVVFCIMHFVGAVLAVHAVWGIGDVAMAMCALPNIVALLLLSNKVAALTNSYFERQPWKQARAEKLAAAAASALHEAA